METVLLLFLLMNFGANGDMKQSLERFLKFYRENRELIALFTNGVSGAKGTTSAQAAASPASCEEQEKSRPLDENGNLNILEEFLKTRAV